MKQKKRLLIAGMLFVTTISFSQTTINVGSNTSTIQGILHDYSIGEMTVVSTEKTSHLIVTQGLLQPSSLSNGKNDNSSTTHSSLMDNVKVYPNPTENILYIELIDEGNYSYQVVDALGKVVLSEKNIVATAFSKLTLNLGSFTAGNYYLMLENNQSNDKQSYKIQKTN